MFWGGVLGLSVFFFWGGGGGDVLGGVLGLRSALHRLRGMQERAQGRCRMVGLEGAGGGGGDPSCPIHGAPRKLQRAQTQRRFCTSRMSLPRRDMPRGMSQKVHGSLVSTQKGSTS